MLNDAQIATLRADILATPELAALAAQGAIGPIVTLYNTVADPAFVVWKSAVTWDEIMLNGMDWARVDNLSVGKARIWDWMFQNGLRSMNPSKANIRAGIDSAWVGTAADLAVRASVYTHCKRQALRGEKVFATGTGSDGVPATMGFEGNITDVDIEKAVRGG
jgi:hypothetical protein